MASKFIDRALKIITVCSKAYGAYCPNFSVPFRLTNRQFSRLSKLQALRMIIFQGQLVVVAELGKSSQHTPSSIRRNSIEMLRLVISILANKDKAVDPDFLELYSQLVLLACNWINFTADNKHCATTISQFILAVL